MLVLVTSVCGRTPEDRYTCLDPRGWRMGTYTSLTVAGYQIWSTKSRVDPGAMTVFRESDRRVSFEAPAEGDDEEMTVVYACKVWEAVQRLNIMGYTMTRVKGDFETIRRSEIENFERLAQEDDGADWFRERWTILKELTFEGYCNGFGEVLRRGLSRYSEEGHRHEPMVGYILGDNEDFHFGFLAEDIRNLIRLACELADPSDEIIQDISGLVYGGYYSKDEPVCEMALRELVSKYPENAPRIILTEGSTDGWILREALDLLYPHLSGYYSFLDFESTGAPGGAGHLVRIVQAFAGAGITNRVIALLDNDAAARDARRSLQSVRLPANIVVRQYPDLDELRSYPTLGTAGASSQDINGLAASVELYLGTDVLAACNNPPVKWGGYIQTVGGHQGELRRKSQIHKAFRRKIERCRTDSAFLEAADWTGLRAILNSVFTAFD